MATAELPAALYRAAAVRELDRRAIEDHSIPGSELMERAGASAYRLLRASWPDARHLAILCGSGNNGGDGFILARLATTEGLQVSLMLKGRAGDLTGDARRAWDRLAAGGVDTVAFSPTVLEKADVIVDAMLGTGLDRDVSGELRTWIEAVNDSPRPVLAIDIPSGLHADIGQALGVAVMADCTVSFIGLKVGLFTGEGRRYAGRIRFAGLDVPAAVYEGVPVAARRIDHNVLRIQLRWRDRTAHKGHFGHVLIIGGDAGFAGAVRLAGEAAARVGAGLVSIATRAEHAACITQQRPELMVHAVEEPAALAPLLERATVVAAGPGLGQSDWAAALLNRVIDCSQPLVVDADGLNLLASDPVRRDYWILTPHPGEAARLLDSNSRRVQSDRLQAAADLQARYGGSIVLKGSGTLIASADGVPALCSDGNPGMATGGMGDVLTGVIAGLLAQGFSGAMAAELGVCLHAAAADRAAAAGERGLLASDLFAPLRQLVNPE